MIFGIGPRDTGEICRQRRHVGGDSHSPRACKGQSKKKACLLLGNLTSPLQTFQKLGSQASWRCRWRPICSRRIRRRFPDRRGLSLYGLGTRGVSKPLNHQEIHFHSYLPMSSSSTPVIALKSYALSFLSSGPNTSKIFISYAVRSAAWA